MVNLSTLRRPVVGHCAHHENNRDWREEGVWRIDFCVRCDKVLKKKLIEK